MGDIIEMVYDGIENTSGIYHNLDDNRMYFARYHSGFKFFLDGGTVTFEFVAVCV